MSELAIGVWTRRSGQKWHLVDSTIDGDAITRCGRRMNPDGGFRGGELQVSALMPLTRMIGQPQLCRAGCQRDAVSEDDGSTVDETEPA
jgi:hypothetical protein